MAQRMAKLYVIAHYPKRSGIWSTAVLHDATMDDAFAWNKYQTEQAGEETILCVPSFRTWKRRKESAEFKDNFDLIIGE